MRPDIVEIVKTLSPMFEVGITTNGTLTKRKLPKLVDAGLTHINVSLDSLVEAKNTFITRRDNTTNAALDTVDRALEAGLVTKLNNVVMKNFNEDELVDFVNLTKDRQLQVRFIEFMPFGLNDWKSDKFVSQSQMLERIREKIPNFEKLNDPKTSTSQNYRVAGYKGSFGFISSMSNHFCGGCNRLRITADGCFKVCLFDNREVNLKTLMDQGCSDEELIAAIRRQLNKKHFSHGGVDTILGRENRPMVRIGG